MDHRARLATLLPAVCLLVFSACGGGADGGNAEPGSTLESAPSPSPVRPADGGTDLPAERLRGLLADLDGRSPETSCLVVSHGGDVLFEHRADLPLVPASATKLLTAASAIAAGADANGDGRVPELVAAALRNSDNDAARELLARVGGADRAQALLAEAGFQIDGVEIVDGTGHDRNNRATCHVLHAILDRAIDDRAVDDRAIDAGLAVAGRSGTLATRFLGTPAEGRLRAKTGSIRGVAALAGYVERDDGTSLTFVQLLNGVSVEFGNALQEELVTILLGPRGEES